MTFPDTSDTNDAPAGQGAITYTYGWANCPDANNRDANNPYYLYSVKDEAGNVTVYKRDTKKRISSITYADGSYETFAYDDATNHFNQVISHRLTTGGVESFTYDTRGMKTEYRDPYHPTGNANANATARYRYDGLDRLYGVTDPLGSGTGDVGHTTSFNYNNRGQLTITTLPQDPNDGTRHTVVKTYNAPDGTLASVTDQLGHVTRYTYDDYRRVRTATSPGHNSPATTSYFYDPDGTANDDYTLTPANVTLAILPGGERTQTVYDPNLRKLTVTVAQGSTDAAKTNFVYDNVGNVTAVGLPNEQLGQQFYGVWATTTYDERNRLYQAKDPLGNTTTFRYDAYGRKASVTRANGQVVTFNSYDAMNRVTQQTATQAPDPAAVTKYTYDPSGGQLQTMTDPNGNVYTYVYDLMNRRTQLWYPADSGNIQRDEIWHYDVANRLDTFTNRAGKVQTFTYDNLNRVTLSNWNDTVTPDVTTAYDAANRITSITNSNSTITRTYYNDNLLTTETNTYGDGIDRIVSYAYDSDGRRQWLTYPNNDYSFKYTYTDRSQVETIVWGASTIATYGYEPNGNLQTRTLDNSTSSAYYYDALDRATNINHGLVGTTRTFGYNSDSVGNRNWVKRDANLGDAYDYDKADQVMAVKLNIANPDAANAAGPQTIVYDATGNRTTFSAYGPTDTYTINGLNQYTTRNSSHAVYDANGNMTTGLDGSTYTYDAQNRLLTAKKGTTIDTFAYDGLNRQISKKVGTQPVYYRVYDGWDLLGEYKTGTAGALWAYLYGPGGLVKNLVTNNYYYQDASGSTSHLANASGALIEWYRYDLHGTPIFYNASDAPINDTRYGIRHLFTGQQYYNEIDLYDLRNRYYSPDIGRFLQADPASFGGDDSNLYRYCGNNPLTRSDPSGLGYPGWFKVDPQRVVVTASGYPFSDDPFLADLSLTPGDASKYLSVIGGGTGPGGGGGLFHFHVHSGVTSPGPTIGKPPLGSTTAPAKPSALSFLKAALDDALMFDSFESGAGPTDYYYGPDSAEAQYMADSSGVQDAVARYWWNNTGQDWTEATPVNAYPAHFGPSNILATGPNPTQQFVGSSTVRVSAFGPNAVNVTISNRTSLWSFGYHALPPSISIYNRPFGAPVPFGNIYQTIAFPLPYP